MTRTLWIRADGSTAIGLGHLSRTSALAEVAAERALSPVYVTTEDEVARSFLHARGLQAHWLASSSDLRWVDAVDADDLVLFDRYDVLPTEVEAVRSTGAVAAALDDHGSPSLAVDLIINPNDIVDRGGLPPWTTVLSGPQHALVRAAFRARRRRRDGGDACLVVTMGGSDTGGHGASVLRALSVDRKFRQVVLVEGPAADPTGFTAPWLSTVRDPTEIAEVFDGADAAITAAGSTTWELLAMGVPTAVVALSDNQLGIAGRATSAGAALPLPATLPADVVGLTARRLAEPPEQRRLSDAAMVLVDGAGATRVLDGLLAVVRR